LDEKAYSFSAGVLAAIVLVYRLIKGENLLTGK